MFVVFRAIFNLDAKISHPFFKMIYFPLKVLKFLPKIFSNILTFVLKTRFFQQNIFIYIFGILIGS